MGNGYAFRCEVCDVDPTWTVVRRGDVVVSWACPIHLSEVCERLQRDWELTELVVRLSAKAAEWAEIDRTLAAAARVFPQPQEGK